MKLDQKNMISYGQARAKDVAYDAVMRLWEVRKSEGMTQKDLAKIIGRDESWVSKTFRGPGNWTFKTMGALVAALNGDLEIDVYPCEQVIHVADQNFHAYDEFEHVASAHWIVSHSAHKTSSNAQVLKVQAS